MSNGKNKIKDAAISGDVAIVGMACVFPKAPDLKTYWENILSKTDAICDPPADRGIDQYFDPEDDSNDRIYCKRGGYIDGLPDFDAVGSGIMPVSVEGSEPEHFMALHVAKEALKDAGYPEKPFDRERTEVILGRGTFVNRGYISLLQHGFIIDQTINLLRQINPQFTTQDLKEIKKQLKASIPSFSAETAPGLAHSVMAGIVANRLDLKGPAIVVDAACASCLIALDIAYKNLVSGKSEAAIIGGVQISTPAVIHMLFTQLGALSRHPQLRPFDKDADGTMLGEGIGMMVLKRKEDAIKDGHRIYAIIKGLGTSSDGKAMGLLAPRLEGEVLALKRAYEYTGIDPSTIRLIEAHGTGLPLGDATEIKALKTVFGSNNGISSYCAVGTVKSMIGHLIPAAGVAALIKTALAVYHNILPPTLHCDEPNPEFGIEKTPFYFNTETRPWIHGAADFPKRAGVNAFGFGGINTHAILEGADPTFNSDRKNIHAKWDSELFLFEGDTRNNLIEQCENLEAFILNNTSVALSDIAFTINTISFKKPLRLSLIAGSIEELLKKLDKTKKRLREPDRKKIQDRSGVFFYEEPLHQAGKTAFLFPGEGSQYVNMLSDLCIQFPVVRSCFDLLDRAYADHPKNYRPSRYIFPPTQRDADEAENKIWEMDSAVDSVITADRALFRLLSQLGVLPNAILGHSSGEIMALEAAGALYLENDEEIIHHIRAGNRFIESLSISEDMPEANLLAVGGVDYETISKTVDESEKELVLAMDNCPHQYVLCGSETAVGEAAAKLRKKGAICQNLPFKRPYHTHLFDAALKTLKTFFDDLKIVSPQIPMYSCMTAGPMREDPKDVRKLVVGQWSRRVRFRETIQRMYDDGFRIFIEVGPKANLTGFVNDILNKKKILAISANVSHRSGIVQLNHLVGMLFAHGLDINTGALYANRIVNRVDIDNVAPPRKSKAVKISVSLPELSLPDDMKGVFLKENKPVTTGEPVIGNRKAIIDSREIGNIGVTATKNDKSDYIPATDSDLCSNGTEAMDAYFSTMERFLEVQEEVMQTYLSKDAASGVSYKPIPSYVSNDAIQTVYPENIASSLPAEINDSPKPHELSEAPLTDDKASDSSDTEDIKSEDIEKMVLTCVSERTGYPEDMLDMGLNMEADLGIDSIKRVEIVSALSPKLGTLEEGESELLYGMKTLREIVDFLVDRKTGKESTNTYSYNERPEKENGQEPVVSTFQGEIVEYIPGKKITILRRFGFENDPLLRHHTLGGHISKNDEALMALPVIPLAISVEIMAQTAAGLFHGLLPIKIKNIRSHDWVVLEDESIELRVEAEASENAENEAGVRLFVSNSDNGQLHPAVEGIFVFSNVYPEIETLPVFSLKSESTPSIQTDQYYPSAMFHGKMFQSIKSLNKSGEDGMEAELIIPDETRLFSGNMESNLTSAPVLIDGAGQVVGMWAIDRLDNDFIIFPVSVDEIVFYDMPLDSSTHIDCRAKTSLEGDRYIRSNIDLLKPEGELYIRISGLRHKRMQIPELFHRFRGSRDVLLSSPCQGIGVERQNAASIICRLMDRSPIEFWKSDDGFWAMVLAYIALSRNERKTFMASDGRLDSRNIMELLYRVAGKEAVRELLKERCDISVWHADIEIEIKGKEEIKIFGKWVEESGLDIKLVFGDVGGFPAAIACLKGESLKIDEDFCRKYEFSVTGLSRNLNEKE